MNMERIEAEIRMFDRLELIFAIGAALAAAALLALISVKMKRNEIKPGRRVLALGMAVLLVTGIYTGTVVFADEESQEILPEEESQMADDPAAEGSPVTDEPATEESSKTESESPCMNVIDSIETPGEAVIEITGNVFDGCILKLTVTDEEETAEPEETAGFEQPVEMEELPEGEYLEESGSGESAENRENAEKEIEISLFTGMQVDDTSAKEIFLAEQTAYFDAAGLILKDAVIEDGVLRLLVSGLKEEGSKYIKAVLIYGEEMQETEFEMTWDGIEGDGEENVLNPEEAGDNLEPGSGKEGTIGAGGMPGSGEEGASEPVQQNDWGEMQNIGDQVFEEDGEQNSEDQSPPDAETENSEEHTPTEDEIKDIEEQIGSENEEKDKKDEESPVIVIRPDNEGSGFKVSADTEETVKNVYISEAKEIRIIETNAEEIDDSEVVYTVNGETYPMVYGADYTIEKQDNGKVWQYEYVVAPHVFEKDGYYNINIISRDKSGNISNNKTAGTDVSFVVDRTPPTIIVTNLADGGVYGDGEHKYNITLKDNTLLKYFRIYENRELKAEYLYDREKWINTKDKTEVLDAPGGTVTLTAEASGKTTVMEFEAEDESGNICISGNYHIVVGKSRASRAIPFAFTAGLLTLVAAGAVKLARPHKTNVRHRPQ